MNRFGSSIPGNSLLPAIPLQCLATLPAKWQYSSRNQGLLALSERSGGNSGRCEVYVRNFAIDGIVKQHIHVQAPSCPVSSLILMYVAVIQYYEGWSGGSTWSCGILIANVASILGDFSNQWLSQKSHYNNHYFCEIFVKCIVIVSNLGSVSVVSVMMAFTVY